MPHEPIVDGQLADLVGKFVNPRDLPPTEWLTRIHWTAPRPTLRTISPRRRTFKRAGDIVIALGALALAIPFMALIALLVRCTSRGPAIFRQLRVGLNLRESRGDRRLPGSTILPTPAAVGERRSEDCDRRKSPSYGKPFVVYKFRTMYLDAEKDGARFAQKDDPRVTPVGRFLRRTRLDELPQLWNVLRGDMSLVGPRPERPEFMEVLCKEIPSYNERLGLRPGVTGLAQVLNGYDNTIESFHKKVALDLLYLQNCCLRNDLKIIFRTLGVVVSGKGAL